MTTTPGQLLSLPGLDNLNNMTDLTFNTELPMFPQQNFGQGAALPLKKRSYAEMNTQIDSTATTYGDLGGGLKKFTLLDNILEKANAHSLPTVDGTTANLLTGAPFGNFTMLPDLTQTQPIAAPKPKKPKNAMKEYGKPKKATTKTSSSAHLVAAALKAQKPPALKKSRKPPATKAGNKRQPSSSSSKSAKGARKVGLKAGSKATPKAGSPKSPAKRTGKKNAKVSSTTKDLTDSEKRERKNEREKQRRLMVNKQFSRLSELLGFDKNGSTDKVTILEKAVKTIETMQTSYIQPPLSGEHIPIPF
mmetsp:Transcript_10731/g.12362  ORF Transcript_10731/g.12362 Transcript_10731/m.12362 type:complete len:305 (+) Transcript_10731:279-1193(+)